LGRSEFSKDRMPKLSLPVIPVSSVVASQISSRLVERQHELTNE
jgi:hypothetical protein